MKADKRIDADPEANDELAAEGYRFYAQEASEFAESSANAVAEALNHAGLVAMSRNTEKAFGPF